MFSLTKSFLIPLTLQAALYAIPSSADLVINWSSYPSGSVNCLNHAQASAKCPSKDVPSFNGCVCKNGNGFLQTAATCLGSGDPGDVADVFNQLSTNCAGTNIPVNINLAQWNAWASPADSITAHPSTSMITQPPSSQTSVGIITTLPNSGGSSGKASVTTLTPDQATTIATINVGGSSAPTNTLGVSSSGGGPKLGIGAIAGIAVGCAVVIAIIGLIAVLLLRRSRNQPTTVSPAAAAAAVPLAPLKSDIGTGCSSGTAQANPYKTDRTVLSIPSTVSSDANKTGADFDTPQ